ncbi:hypothetical protein Dimus_021197 [Dionaea muscipula]
MSVVHLKKKDVVKTKVRGVDMEFDHEKLATILVKATQRRHHHHFQPESGRHYCLRRATRHHRHHEAERRRRDSLSEQRRRREKTTVRRWAEEKLGVRSAVIDLLGARSTAGCLVVVMDLLGTTTTGFRSAGHDGGDNSDRSPGRRQALDLLGTATMLMYLLGITIVVVSYAGGGVLPGQ